MRVNSTVQRDVNKLASEGDGSSGNVSCGNLRNEATWELFYSFRLAISVGEADFFPLPVRYEIRFNSFCTKKKSIRHRIFSLNKNHSISLKYTRSKYVNKLRNIVSFSINLHIEIGFVTYSAIYEPCTRQVWITQEQ